MSCRPSSCDYVTCSCSFLVDGPHHGCEDAAHGPSNAVAPDTTAPGDAHSGPAPSGRSSAIVRPNIPIAVVLPMPPVAVNVLVEILPAAAGQNRPNQQENLPAPVLPGNAAVPEDSLSDSDAADQVNSNDSSVFNGLIQQLDSASRGRSGRGSRRGQARASNKRGSSERGVSAQRGVLKRGGTTRRGSRSRAARNRRKSRSGSY